MRRAHSPTAETTSENSTGECCAGDNSAGDNSAAADSTSEFKNDVYSTGACMITARTIHELRECLQPARVARQRIGLVPTMGAFHAGHLHLMHTARDECGFCVVSLFVNPTQFGDATDLAAYPNDFARDALLASEAGVDVMFAPSASEMYPQGFDTVVEVGAAACVLEGAARGADHFRGVATIVSKLLNIVQPHVAYFGQKDFQQTVVIRQLVRDLDIPVDIAVCSTIREPDGLAMSSRNVRLSPEARAQAPALFTALRAAQQASGDGEQDALRLQQIAREVLNTSGIANDSIDYLAVVDAMTLADVASVNSVVGHETTVGDPDGDGVEMGAGNANNLRRAVMAVAARIGGVRLIDNVVLNEHVS